eukprot:gene1126-biopygen219
MPILVVWRLLGIWPAAKMTKYESLSFGCKSSSKVTLSVRCPLEVPSLMCSCTSQGKRDSQKCRACSSSGGVRAWALKLGAAHGRSSPIHLDRIASMSPKDCPN